MATMIKLKLNASEMLALSEALDKTTENMQMLKNKSLLSKEDMLLLSVFEEMNMHFALKAYKRQHQYLISMKPYWAIAFNMQFDGFTDKASYLGNLLQGICDKISVEAA